MCYSKRDSENAFIINMITCYILYTYKNDNTLKILGLFFGFVGLMQLFDLIFWNNQNLSNTRQANINYITTKIAMFANHLQPIVLGYLIWIYKGEIGGLSSMILGIYAILMILYTIEIYDKVKYTTRDGEGVPLKWDWNYQKNASIIYGIFLLTLLILSYENFKYPLNIILAGINVLTFVLSLYYVKGKFVGRFWCKIAAWVPLFIILMVSISK